jgi:ABC-2 type transport system ATP-binding protein
VNDAAVATDGLTKRYGTETAVDDLALRVESGEIYGFLGPNGAGKSTTLGMLLDYIRPTAGEIRVLGADPRADVVEVHQCLGVLPDRYSLYEDLSARQHLEFVIDTKGATDTPEALLERVGLAEAVDKAAEEYSQGMEQRLALAMALVGDPDLLLLDEPFTGLDPHGVRTVRDIIHAENDRGATVLFSSHVLGQVELVCDRLGIMYEGRLVADGTADAVRERAGLNSEASMESVFVELTGEHTADSGGEE